MDVFRTKFIGAALLSCLLTPSSPTVGEPATCSADKYCGYFWSGAHVETREPRLPEVDLQGRAATATRIRQAIIQLALDDLGSDEILLIELVIKNGRILGPLVLENLTVPFGLRFESVSLPAAKFRNTDFQKQLTFSNVRWHRRFYADKSEFQQGLEFRSGTRFENQDRSVTTVLQIDKSAIDRDMLISQTSFFGDVALYNNKIGPALRIDSSHFNYSIGIQDNEIGNLDFYNTMLNGDLELFSNNIERMELKDVYVFGTMDINQNLFLDYVTIASVVLAPKQGGPEARIVFANNEISKELQFSADYVSSVVDEIELVANTVRGRTLLEFPWDRLHCGELPPPSWLRNVRLNLQNSRFESELRPHARPVGKVRELPCPSP